MPSMMAAVVAMMPAVVAAHMVAAMPAVVAAMMLGKAWCCCCEH
jgi:hypothetical protein